MKDINYNIIGTGRLIIIGQARLTIVGQASGQRKKEHKGKVLVKSGVGKGTTFIVKLPLK